MAGSSPAMTIFGNPVDVGNIGCLPTRLSDWACLTHHPGAWPAPI